MPDGFDSVLPIFVRLGVEHYLFCDFSGLLIRYDMCRREDQIWADEGSSSERTILT